MSVIEVQNLTKSYGSNLVLDGLTFQIEAGEIFALLGKNGAGKTTALECIEGMRTYEKGSIRVNGKLGIQLQSASLPPHIRPLEAITLFAKWNKRAFDPDMISRLGIRQMEKTQYHQLSTGQKRRLHLALALTNQPDIVILDEPTAGLDVEGRRALHEQIRGLKAEGKTLVLSSHDMAEVEALCDRAGILKGGKLIFCGTPSEMAEQAGNQFVIRIRTKEGIRTYRTDRIGETVYAVLGKLRQSGLEVLDLKVDRGTLEEQFMEIAGGEGK